KKDADGRANSGSCWRNKNGIKTRSTQQRIFIGPCPLPFSAGGSDLVVASGRSSVAVADLNGDGRKDLILGDTEGQLLFYANVETDGVPAFDGSRVIEADGAAIDLAGLPRSRPFVGDFDNGSAVI
ncbi:MAG: hypothetical protein ACQESR_21530, partial [Planctomycetota bacterium]